MSDNIYSIEFTITRRNFTIRREPSQANSNPKTLLSKCLPQRLHMVSGQDILKWCFLGYVEFCFSRIYWAHMDAGSESLIHR
jgi:hypothetical protein